MKGAAVVGVGVGRWVLGDGHWRRAARQAQVEEAAQRVTQRVVAAAVDPNATPAAVACAIGTQGDAVAAVAQHVGGLYRVGTGQDLAQRPGRAVLQGQQGPLGQTGRQVKAGRHFTWWAFVQQGRHRLQLWVAHAPALCHTVHQRVGQRDDAHALVVGHEGADGREFGLGVAATAQPGAGVVQGFDEAMALPCAQRCQPAQVGQRPARRQLRSHHGGVRRHHAVFRWCAAQGQPRHTLGRVLVGQAAVARRVGRLGNAPGQVLRLPVVDLLADGGVAGLVQHTAPRLGQHQTRHQVLEHRARPRTQSHRSTHRVEGPPQRRPVAHRHIGLGNGQQAGQARFRRQQVVEAGVQLLFGHPQAQVHQVTSGVVEAGEVGLPGQAFAVVGHGVQAPCGGGHGLRWRWRWHRPWPLPRQQGQVRCQSLGIHAGRSRRCQVVGQTPHQHLARGGHGQRLRVGTIASRGRDGFAVELLWAGRTQQHQLFTGLSSNVDQLAAPCELAAPVCGAADHCWVSSNSWTQALRPSGTNVCSTCAKRASSGARRR